MLYINGTELWKRYFYMTLIFILSFCVHTIAADADSIDADDLLDMSIE